MPQTIPALPVHRYRLRPDCTVRLALPDDLTRRETKRLALFLASLVREAAWPYPVCGDADDDDELEDDEEDFLDEKKVQAWLDGDGIVNDFPDFDDTQPPAPQPER